MKKITAILMVLLAVLSLCACGAEKAQTEQAQYTVEDKYPDRYRVGYARANITPDTSVPIAGMGNVSQRMANQILDQLYMTCIAVTGENNETVLMFSIDNMFTANYNVFQPMLTSISEAVGVPAENISYTCTHTHSAPDISSSEYYGTQQYAAKVGAKIIPLAVEALNDRRPTTVSVGSVETEGMNFTRHYYNLDADGNKLYFGDNFGSGITANASSQHTRLADPTMYVVKFTRQDAKPVILMNFRMHPHFFTSQTSYKITGDAISYIRDAVEMGTDCYFAYYQGAAGNVNNTSYLKTEMQTTDAATYGRIMYDYVAACLGNMTEVKTGAVQVISEDYQADANHEFDDVYVHAREVQAVWNATNSQQAAKEAGAPYGIRSPYHANSIVSNYLAPANVTMLLKTIRLGDNLAICTSAGEPFSESSEWVEENSPFAYTLFFGYSGEGGYLPSEFCYTYSSYETDVTRTVAGTAEKLNAEHIRMLNELVK